MNAVRPYPWSALDSLRRADVEALRELRRWCASVTRLEEAATALAEIVGVRVGISLRHAQRGGRVRNLDDGVGVVLARADALGDEASHVSGALVEVDGALAAALVARALKRPAPRVMAPSHVHSPNVAGALGAVLVAAARRAHAGSPLRILGAGPAAALGQDVADLARVPKDDAAAAPTFDVATFTVTLDHDAYLARITVPRGRLREAPDAWDSAALAALGETPIELPVVACSTLMTVAEAGMLGRGEVLLPGAWPLHRTASGGLAGRVTLAAEDLDAGIAADLGEDGRLVLRDGIKAMNEDERRDGAKDAVVEAVGEAPVVVRVEVGAARMRAREWAALGPGDVVALGRRIAEPVVLRIGGAEVARGELVEVEGEVGVRILARSGESVG